MATLLKIDKYKPTMWARLKRFYRKWRYLILKR